MRSNVRALGQIVGAFIAATAAVGCNISGLGGPMVTGAGDSVKQPRPVGSFTRLNVQSGIQADVKIGSPASVVVEVQPNLQSYIETKVEGDTLTVSTTGSISTDHPLLVHVVVPALTECNFSGGSQGQVDGVSGDNFKSDISGGAQVKFNGSATTMDFEASGGAQVVLAGLNVDQLVLNASGGASLLAGGKANSLTTEATGGAQVHAEELEVQTAKVSASGAGTLALKVEKTIQGDASGASTVRVSGKATGQVSTTGASSFDHTP